MTDETRKSATQAKRKKVDWDAVERDYRTGKFTLRELEAKHGAFNTSIARKAKKDGWKQDLSEAIRQETNSRLAQALVSNIVSESLQDVRKTVSTAAEINTQVILGHRQGLRDITAVRNILLSQVAQAAANLPELERIVEMMRNPDDNGLDKANDALRKALSRPALIDDLKKLAEVDERVRKGEREAFNIGLDSAMPSGMPKRVVLDFEDVTLRDC